MDLRRSVIQACEWLLLVGISVLSPGAFVSCASVVNVSVSGHPTVVSQSYELPATLESNRVIEAAERSFTRILSGPPRTTEGSVPSPLPATAPSFAIEERHVELDRLGIVTIPTVVCPDSLAVLHGFGQTIQRSLPFRYAGCIQFYAGGYRVHFVASAMLPSTSAEEQAREMTDVIQRLGGHFTEQVAEARIAVVTRTAVAGAPDGATQTASLNGVAATRRNVTGMGSDVDAPDGRRSSVAASAPPLVCLAASKTSAPIRSERGGGRIVGELEPGSVVAVMEPADPSYFWVQTEEQHTGWVNHNDVKRLRCPVG
jgi:hypothetical protein